MKPFIAASLIALIATTVLAQCQAGAINTGGVCNNNGGTEYVYGYSTTTALYNNSSFHSTIVVYLAGIGYTTRTVAFNSTTSTPMTSFGYQIRPFMTAAGVPGFYLYGGGIYIMTVTRDNPTQLHAFDSWLAAQKAQNPNYWNQNWNWITDLYWAIQAGGASSACNLATIEMEGTAALMFGTFWLTGPGAGLTITGSIALYLAQIKRVHDACPF